MRWSRVRGLLPLILAGCTFVGAEQVQQLIDELDADGDGVPAHLDCDDYDPLRYPQPPPAEGEPPTDIPYDHIDNDCGGGGDTLRIDLVDVDGDGFPGVDYQVYAAEHREMFGLGPDDPIPWPENVSKTVVDCVDQDDERTRAAGVLARDIFPGALSDVAYDGIDQDCMGDNDFDADKDGQMPPTINGQPTRPLVEAYLAAHPSVHIDLQAEHAFGDCDDNLASVYAGNPVDTPYNGRDDDCSGDNDFDQDGDGYYPSRYTAQFNTFVATYYPETNGNGPNTWGPTPGTPAQPGDCLDKPHPHLPHVDPATVFPGADDAWYDGVDSNCGIDPNGNPLLNNNDFDQDGDGYIRLEDGNDFDLFVVNWSGDINDPDFPATIAPDFTVPPDHDCDDTNPIVAPGNLELLFDDADADCDANADTTPFAFGDAAWLNPVRPRISRTDEHYIVSGSGRERSVSGATPVEQVAAVQLFLPDVGYAPAPYRQTTWNATSSQTVLQGLGSDLHAIGDRFWVANTYLYSSPTTGQSRRVLLREYVYSSAVSGGGLPYIQTTAQDQRPWFGFDVGLDLTYQHYLDGTANTPAVWMAVCGGGGRDRDNDFQVVDDTARNLLVYGVTAPVVQNVIGFFRADVSNIPNDADVCFLIMDPGGQSGQATACDSTGCVSYDINVLGNSLTLATTQPWENRLIRAADTHDGQLILVNQTSGIEVVDIQTLQSITLLADFDVVSADVMYRGDTLFVAAVVADLDPNQPNKLMMGWTTDPGVTPPTLIEVPVYDNDRRFTHEPNPPDCDDSVLRCETGRNLNPLEISLHVDQDRLGLAVSAASLDVALTPNGAPLSPGNVFGQDAIGWLFLGFNGEPE